MIFLTNRLFCSIMKGQRIRTLKSLILLMGKHKILFWGALITLTIGIGFEATGRFLIRFIIDHALNETVTHITILPLVFQFIGCTGCMGFFLFLFGRWKTRASENIAMEIRQKLYDHIQRLSFKYHDRTPVGELVQRTTSDVDTVRKFYSDHVPGLVGILLRTIIYFTVLFIMNHKIALSCLMIYPFVAATSIFFFKRIYDAYERHQSCEGEVSSSVMENLGGIRVVRAFAMQKEEMAQFEKKNIAQRNAGMKAVAWDAAYWPLAHILCGLQVTVSILVAGFLVFRGEGHGGISVGTMIAATFMFNGIIWPLQELGRMITQISRSFVSFDRIAEIMEEEQEVSEDQKDGSINSGEIKGSIEFNKVNFSYIPDAPVLKNISFSCNPGEKIALLGETGSGKTSIVNLLLRFYDYDNGTILLDGKRLEHHSRVHLRKNIGIVEQNPFLFTMSIRDNIAYSMENDVEMKDIIRVAKAASVHESIVRFPLQYETLVGEKGVSLSGGQKQRIAIARTLLKDPRILILDDSTSAVDAQTEHSIREALDNLMKNRTTFIIAHRIQTLQAADKILVIKNGQIIQAGNHKTLLKEEGFYKEVYKLQTKMEDKLLKELNYGN